MKEQWERSLLDGNQKDGKAVEDIAYRGKVGTN
jgi:hypothetical protein